MPVIKIDMWKGRDTETKKKLIESISNATSETLGIPIEHTTVIMNEVQKENWGLKGKPASEY